MNEQPTFIASRQWRAFHKNVTIKISHTEDPYLNDGFGAWCYYIRIHERFCPGFEELWLPAKRVKYFEDSPERLSFEYGKTKVACEAEWHGGVTYYAKHGQETGHRTVEFGCDYSHLWDQERGFENITLEEVQCDAIRTADEIVELLSITQA